MRRHRFLPGDDAVSPVIGVVLLVAIAVTLMATIGAFVLGFGPGDQAPNGDVLFSQNSDQNVTVTVAWSDGLLEEEVEIIVDDEQGCAGGYPAWNGTGPLEEGDEVTVDHRGSSCSDSIDTNQTIRVVWSPTGSSRTEVLAEFEVF